MLNRVFRWIKAIPLKAARIRDVYDDYEMTIYTGLLYHKKNKTTNNPSKLMLMSHNSLSQNVSTTTKLIIGIIIYYN